MKLQKKTQKKSQTFWVRYQGLKLLLLIFYKKIKCTNLL